MQAQGCSVLLKSIEVAQWYLAANPGQLALVLMAEAQVGYVMRALAALDAERAAAVEPRVEAQRRWNEAVQRRMQGTVWIQGGCASWYLDERGRNTTLWPDFTFRFFRELRRFDRAEHRFTAVPAREAVPVAV